MSFVIRSSRDLLFARISQIFGSTYMREEGRRARLAVGVNSSTGLAQVLTKVRCYIEQDFGLRTRRDQKSEGPRF